MRYIKLMFGLLKMYFYKFCSFGRISFVFPVKMEKNATFSRRRGGKIILRKHVSIGNNAHISVTENAMLSIGSYSRVGTNNIIVARESIDIGNYVMIGPNVCIYDHDHVYKTKGIMRDAGFTTAPVTIEDDVWVGAGAIILKGVTIGSGSIIGAGSVITKDIPQNAIIHPNRDMVIRQKIVAQ